MEATEFKRYTTKELNDKLPDATRQKYKLVELDNRSTRFHHAMYGEVDVTKLSVSRAAQLVKKKAPFIVEITAKESAEVKTEQKADTKVK